MTLRNQISRRSLLKALGLSAAALPLLPTMDAWGETLAPPKRLLLLFVPGGVVDSNFWPSGGPTDFTFAPGSILEPLAPHRENLLILKNVQRPWHSLGGTHERAIGCLWTGSRLNPGNQFGGAGWPSGPSLDQIMARALPPGPDFASLAVGVQPFGPGAAGGTMMHSNYVGSDQPLPSEGNPYKLFEKLYGATNPGDAQAIERLRAERRSVIDVLRADLGDALGRVGSSDRRKIEAHLEATRAIERRLESTGAARACAVAPTGTIDVNANENFPQLVKLQSDLLVSAFACDRVRVATLQWSRAFSMVRHTWVGATSEHHTLTHDSGANNQISAIARWYIEQLGYLLSELKKVPEGSGTLLDNTLVVYCNEMNSGLTHNSTPSPTVLAGKLGGAIRTGRFVDYGSSGADHNQLLVTLCHAMGLTSINTVGDLGKSGVLPNVLADAV